jgi:hypothetical protein
MALDTIFAYFRGYDKRLGVALALGLGLVVGGYIGLQYLRVTLIRWASSQMPLGAASYNCPRCGRNAWVSPGREMRCTACGERLAGCAYCGALLAGEQIQMDPTGRYPLCPEHQRAAVWEGKQLRLFATPEYTTPPPDTPRALAARRLYETRIREALLGKQDVSETLFAERDDEAPQRKGLDPTGLPQAVVEARAFYHRAWVKRNNGGVALFRWEMEGRPFYLVRVDSDGSDGWLELYDGDGTPLGYARTEWDWPGWRSRGAIRMRVFMGDPDPAEEQLRRRARDLFGR